MVDINNRSGSMNVMFTNSIAQVGSSELRFWGKDNVEFGFATCAKSLKFFNDIRLGEYRITVKT